METDYEKKYKEALERAKKLYNDAKANEYKSDMEDYEFIFPELAESEDEDERTRKALIETVKCIYAGDTMFLSEQQRDRYLAYLEKQKDLDKMIVISPEVWDNAITDAYENGKKDGEEQKEQKPVIKLVFPKFRVGDIIRNVYDESDKTTRRISYVGEHGYNFDYRHLGDKAGGGSFGFCYEDHYELVEQKPAEWDKEDKEMFEAVDESLYCYESGKAPEAVAQIEAERCWLSSLPERFNLQPKQEWSEEEIIYWNTIKDYFFGIPFDDKLKSALDWFKSLKPSWKPSEQDIKMLEHIIGQYEIGNKNSKVMGYLPRIEELDFLKKVLAKWKN